MAVKSDFSMETAHFFLRVVLSYAIKTQCPAPSHRTFSIPFDVVQRAHDRNSRYDSKLEKLVLGLDSLAR